MFVRIASADSCDGAGVLLGRWNRYLKIASHAIRESMFETEPLLDRGCETCQAAPETITLAVRDARALARDFVVRLCRSTDA